MPKIEVLYRTFAAASLNPRYVRQYSLALFLYRKALVYGYPFNFLNSNQISFSSLSAKFFFR